MVAESTGLTRMSTGLVLGSSILIEDENNNMTHKVTLKLLVYEVRYILERHEATLLQDRANIGSSNILSHVKYSYCNNTACCLSWFIKVFGPDQR